MMDDLEFPEYEDTNKDEPAYEPSEVSVPEIKPNKKKSLNLIPIMVLLLLISALGYIAYDEYVEYRIVKDTELSESAMKYGAEMIIIEIVKIASTCQQVPLSADNQTVNLINVNCIREQNG